MEREQRLRAAYAAFNARDIDAALRQMTADVDWPNAWEGGRVYGHEGVRDYWTRQWSAIDPVVEPVTFTTRPDGSIAVAVDQATRSLDGTSVDVGRVGRVLHSCGFRDDLIARMDVEELTSAG
jgi:ketosteroid isomerase-like protein